MTHVTIREASQLVGRTPATIRRYIRSGRLKAEKEIGKFGEEYRINREDLLALGITPSAAEKAERSLPQPVPAGPPEVLSSAVPISLYNELLMKHERILVQYGMIRAGGQKLLEYKADAEAKVAELDQAQIRYQALRGRALREIGLLRKRLRQAEIQLEERGIENTLLREKIERLEMRGDGVAPADSFQSKVMEIREKERTIAELAGAEPRSPTPYGAPDAWVPSYPPGDRKEDH